MPGKRSDSLENKLRMKIRKSRSAVFVRADFLVLEAEYDYDQIGRALRKLLKAGEILKAGYGLYVKAKVSPFSGKAVPALGIREMTRQAFRKLGVKVEPTEAESLYNQGQSTQVPTGRVIRVNGRIHRKIQYNDVTIAYEFALSNARKISQKRLNTSVKNVKQQDKGYKRHKEP